MEKSGGVRISNFLAGWEVLFVHTKYIDESFRVIFWRGSCQARTRMRGGGATLGPPTYPPSLQAQQFSTGGASSASCSLSLYLLRKVEVFLVLPAGPCIHRVVSCCNTFDCCVSFTSSILPSQPCGRYHELPAANEHDQQEHLPGLARISYFFLPPTSDKRQKGAHV